MLHLRAATGEVSSNHPWLADLLNVEENHAHPFDGRCARLYGELTAED